MELVSPDEIPKAVALSTRAFANDPMERFEFPDERTYQQAWRELGALKFQAAVNSGTCWRTPKFSGTVRCIVPGVKYRDSRKELRDEMIRLLGEPKMAILNEIFGKTIPAIFEGRERWDLSSVAVNPTFQNRGIGRSLVEFVVDRAKQDGSSVCLVASSEANARLYSRLGFSIARSVSVPDGPTIYPMTTD